ncbi:MAG: histidine kinase [Verrucomicrobia bacterium]|nr:histidine kinase [Verrucomicrobiota bacterium]
MRNQTIITGAWLKWTLFLGFWTLIGLSFASQLYLTQAKLGSPVSWRSAAARSLADWYVFAALSLPTMWLARRLSFERAGWQRPVVFHLVASALFSLLWMALRATVEVWRGEISVSFVAVFRHALVATFFFNLLIYWVIVTVSHAFDYYQKFHERELRTAELERRLTEARLQALQMQLNPHFLFNTLHAISALMHQDVEAADRMISRLSDLLRYALESTDAQEVSLRQELDFLDRYLEIEQTRFGDRLTVKKQIAANTLDARVPNLILQPILENAIRHGIEPHARPGRIELRASRDNGALVLVVRDNGAGLQHAPDEGVGLSNTRARLQQLYGDKQRFEFRNVAEGGLEVSLKIPFRLDANEAAPARSGRISQHA